LDFIARSQYAGFSLHAGVGVEAEQRDKLERLTRYMSRPPVAVERLDLTAQGQVRYRLRRSSSSGCRRSSTGSCLRAGGGRCRARRRWEDPLGNADG
jgi:hypothetical protein